MYTFRLPSVDVSVSGLWPHHQVLHQALAAKIIARSIIFAGSQWQPWLVYYIDLGGSNLSFTLYYVKIVTYLYFWYPICLRRWACLSCKRMRKIRFSGN